MSRYATHPSFRSHPQSITQGVHHPGTRRSGRQGAGEMVSGGCVAGWMAGDIGRAGLRDLRTEGGRVDTSLPLSLRRDGRGAACQGRAGVCPPCCRCCNRRPLTPAHKARPPDPAALGQPRRAMRRQAGARVLSRPLACGQEQGASFEGWQGNLPRWLIPFARPCVWKGALGGSCARGCEMRGMGSEIVSDSRRMAGDGDRAAETVPPEHPQLPSQQGAPALSLYRVLLLSLFLSISLPRSLAPSRPMCPHHPNLCPLSCSQATQSNTEGFGQILR